jgi:hypothetical protein
VTVSGGDQESNPPATEELSQRKSRGAARICTGHNAKAKDLAWIAVEENSASLVERPQTCSLFKDKSTSVDSMRGKAMVAKEKSTVVRRDATQSSKFKPPGKTLGPSSQTRKKPRH